MFVLSFLYHSLCLIINWRNFCQHGKSVSTCFPKCWFIRALILTLSMQGWTDWLILRLVFWDVILCRCIDRYIWDKPAASVFWVEELAVQGTNDMDTGRHKQKQKLWEPAGTSGAQIATVLVLGFLPYIIFYYFQTTILPGRWRQHIISNMLYLSINLVLHPRRL